MEDVVARCPDCGTEQGEAFANCFVCLTPSRWWCRVCREWLAARACPACGGGVGVPLEALLGSCAVGGTVPFAIVVRNAGKRLLPCTASSPDSGVSIINPRLLVPPGGSCELRGSVRLPPGVLGTCKFRLAFDGPTQAETLLVVEAAAPAPRLEFLQNPVALSSPNPGGTVRTSVNVKNTGNVHLIARLSCSESWLTVHPPRVELAPGELAAVRLSAKSKRIDAGARTAFVRAVADGGAWESMVRFTLPDAQLAADPIAFGELTPGQPVVAAVVVRNTGRVRVACDLEASVPWFQVRPVRLNLPAGRDKTVRARALITTANDGPLRGELVVSSPAGVVLRVPVTATGKVPKPVLRPIRKQRVRDATGAPVERRFQVANDGEGRLVCAATADQPWVRIVTPALAVGPGKKRKLRYVLDLPVLPRGEHKATITLASNCGTSAVPVTVHVLDPNPVLEVVRGPDLGTVSPDLPLSAFVQVRNGGVGLLTVRAEGEDPRVAVSPAVLDVPAGPPVRFNLTVPVAGLDSGPHEVAIRLTSNGGSGRAAVRFRLPVERIDVPALIDLGDRPAGRPTGDAIRVRNTGPDRVSLRVRSEHAWVRPGHDRLTVNPGETVSVPFRLDLEPGVLGPIVSTILIEGRTVRHAVAIRAIARKVDLIVAPSVVVLGDLAPGAERAFAVEVVNRGEIAVDIRDLRVSGELEVWVRKATVRPGERVELAGRVRVNAKRTGRDVRAVVVLDGDAVVRCVARVVRPVLPLVLAVAAMAGGATACGLVAATGGWRLGAPLALLGLVTGAWLFWRSRR